MQHYWKPITGACLALSCYWTSWQFQAIDQPGLSLVVLIVASALMWATLVTLVDLSATRR